MNKFNIIAQIMLHLAEIKLYYLRKFVATQSEAITIQNELALANGTTQKELLFKLSEIDKKVETERTLYKAALEVYEDSLEKYNNFITNELTIQTNS